MSMEDKRTNEVCEKDTTSQRRTCIFGVPLKSIVLFLVVMIWWYVLSSYMTIGLFDIPSTTGAVADDYGKVVGFIALLVFIVNPILRKIGKRFSFNQLELTTVYVMLFVGIMTSGSLFRGVLFNLRGLGLVNPNVLAKIPLLENFSRLVAPYLDFGLDITLGDMKPPWAEFVVPFCVWIAFALVLIFAQQCLAVIVRRRWNDVDHLMYPWHRPVLPVIQGGRSTDVTLQFNFVFWIGFAISAIWAVLYFIPNVFKGLPEIVSPVTPFYPLIQLLIRNPHLHKAMSGPHSIGFSLFWAFPMLGVAWFVSTNVLLSIWFFYFMKYVFAAVLDVYGLYGYRELPMMQTQGIGAFIGLGIVMLWRMRGELKEIWRSALRPGSVKEPQDSEEAMSYRMAVIGIFASLVITVGFLWLATDVNPLFGFLILGFYLLMDIALGRLRAEAGIGIAHTNFLVTEQVASMFGSSVMRLDNALGLGFLGGLFWRQYPSIGFTLEFMKLGDSQGVRRRTVLNSIWIGLIITMVLGFVIYIPRLFESGFLGNWSTHYIEGQLQWERIADAISQPKEPNLLQIAVAVVSAAFTYFLAEMTVRFSWWPFHPLGLALGLIDWAALVVPACFAAWLLKVVVFRWGGNKLYKTLTPAFIGLILGDVFVYFITSVFLIIRFAIS